MGLAAAAFLLLLIAPVLQAQDVWGVKYTNGQQNCNLFKTEQKILGNIYYAAPEDNILDYCTCRIEEIGHSDAPEGPLVSVSPSGEVEENTTITLNCSSDANPAANYSWYKEGENSSKSSEQNFVITQDISSKLEEEYTSVHFPKAQTDLCSNVKTSGHLEPKHVEEEDVQYSEVSFLRFSSAPRTTGAVDSTDAIYSTVK
ncbi:hypothetical protein D4764_06G0005870 [Takifugu flavidus]|uniref:Ig-like domain-containing protein n=1 Tax=Takifugu flavidus TaxID=433684 RepID=A0A5C6N064_9TELE|nr:hypothetical protein D4764_06G0005870 [Takifugu flavidus]